MIQTVYGDVLQQARTAARKQDAVTRNTRGQQARKAADAIMVLAQREQGRVNYLNDLAMDLDAVATELDTPIQ
jgi:hypothetical protein